MPRACLKTSATILFLLLMASAVRAAPDPFPVYDCIRSNVAFWKQIYSKYSTHQGLIHDTRDLSIVYGTVKLVDFEQPGAREINKNRIKQAKKKYERILARLANGEKPATAEEKRVASLFGPDAGPGDFAAARSRIRFQLGQMNRFREGIIRSGAYLPAIKRVIKSYDLPEDLAYLPHVESSFDYNASSKFGAAGIWQFTRSTGRRFMRVDYTIDERRDPLVSTQAAARFLQEAYDQLQDWPAAITAYNYGLAGMSRAKDHKGCYSRIFAEYEGSRFKFAARNFYSEFLAAREVAKNRSDYFGELKLASPVKTSEIVLAGFAPIVNLASRLHTDLNTLEELNPALREPVFAGRKFVPKGYRLRIPKKSSEQLHSLVASLDRGVYRGQQKRSRFYEVQRGDTASSIARTRNVKLAELIAANGLGRRATIYVGQNLRIPAKDEVVVLAAAKAKRPVIQKAAPEPAPEPVQVAMASQPKETVTDVPPRPLLESAPDVQAPEAEDGPVIQEAPPEPAPEPVQVAMASQPEETVTDVPPRPLLESAPDVPAPETEDGEVNPEVVTGHLAVEKVIRHNGHTYGLIQVEASETLGHYADWLEIPTQSLRRLNGFRYGRAIRIRQKIKIPLDKVGKEQFEERRYEYHKGIEEDFFAAYRSQEVKIYQVRPGDSIWVLCRDEFDIPFWLLKKYNEGVDFSNLKPSQKIVVPVVEKIDEDDDTPAV